MNRPFRPWLVSFPDGSRPPSHIRITEHPYYWAHFTLWWYRLYWLTRKGRVPVRKAPTGNFVRLTRNGHSIQVRPWSHRAEVR